MDPYCTAVPIDYISGNGQTQTGARSRMPFGVGGSEELLEQLFLLGFRNADAGVTDLKRQIHPVRSGDFLIDGYTDAAFFSKFDGIAY